MRFFQLVPTLVAILPLAFASGIAEHAAKTKLRFPPKFLFGTATSAFQIEGGWNEGGRTPSYWDEMCRLDPEQPCANVAVDFYHRYASDIKRVKDDGYNAFRFSVSWSRAMTWDNVTQHMKPNPEGLAFYHSVIDELVRSHIKPILTIDHYEHPLALDEHLEPYGGWLSPAMQDHFVEFATLLFHEFGHQVAYWITFNEPTVIATILYRPPPASVAADPTNGKSIYMAAHNILLAHAKAVRVFRELKAKNVIDSKALVGMVLTSDHILPADPSSQDDAAMTERYMQFTLGWFLNPIVNGDYPALMRQFAQDRLPQFTANESALLKGSYDLFMLNHYSTHTVTSCDSPRTTKPCNNYPVGWYRDAGADVTGKPAGARNSSLDENGQLVCPTFSAYPEGYRQVINYMHAYNTSADILLTENGFCGNSSILGEDQLWYHQTYLEQVHKVITEDKIPVIGYLVWSLTDDFEWDTYKPRLGLYYINYTGQVETANDTWTPKPTDLARIPRLTAKWFSKVAKTGYMEPYEASKD